MSVHTDNLLLASLMPLLPQQVLQRVLVLMAHGVMDVIAVMLLLVVVVVAAEPQN